ncbi:MAG: hypothetical protein AB7I44_21170 [Hyphomicrobiaceae bacterium]
MVAPESLSGTDNVRSLADRISEDYAEAWMPEEGDSLIGHISEISVGNSEYGPYPIVTVLTANGDRWAIHAFHTVLHDAIVEAQPDIGEEVAVKYMGRILPREKRALKLTGKALEDMMKENGYEGYRFIVNRAPANIWGQFRKKSEKD